MNNKPPLADIELGFRLTYDDLAEIMELLFEKFMASQAGEHRQVGEMRRRGWVAAWRTTLAVAGWSEDEFEAICLERLSCTNGQDRTD